LSPSAIACGWPYCPIASLSPWSSGSKTKSRANHGGLAKEEQLRKKRERNDQLGIWSFDRQRAYPEFDFGRPGELSIQIKDEYVGGLRRNWADGKRQTLESLVDDIASGIPAYLAGAKARREEHERRQREWERRQRLAALARAREEREKKRSDFLKRLVAISREADELKLFLACL
jgi:hypothetical protein